MALENPVDMPSVVTAFLQRRGEDPPMTAAEVEELQLALGELLYQNPDLQTEVTGLGAAIDSDRGYIPVGKTSGWQIAADGRLVVRATNTGMIVVAVFTQHVSEELLVIMERESDLFSELVGAMADQLFSHWALNNGILTNFHETRAFSLRLFADRVQRFGQFATESADQVTLEARKEQGGEDLPFVNLDDAKTKKKLAN